MSLTEAAISIWRKASSAPRPGIGASLSTVLAGYISDTFGSSNSLSPGSRRSPRWVFR